jgi:quercetin dioxygenase-like cupin family protein
MTPDLPSGLAVGPDEQQRLSGPLGGDVIFIVRGEQSNGALTALEVRNPPGEGPPLHLHDREDETMFVLAGDHRIRLGDEVRTLPTGSFVFIPHGVPHCFQNIGDDEGRMLVTFAPAGMERFFERLSRIETFDPDEFRRAATESGMEIVGPPLAESNPL